MSNDEARALAARLTDAQRRALLAMTDPDRTYAPADLKTSGSTLIRLMDFDRDNRGVEPPIMLVSRDYADWPRLHWRYTIEPDGLQVRAILTESLPNEQ